MSLSFSRMGHPCQITLSQESRAPPFETGRHCSVRGFRAVRRRALWEMRNYADGDHRGRGLPVHGTCGHPVANPGVQRALVPRSCAMTPSRCVTSHGAHEVHRRLAEISTHVTRTFLLESSAPLPSELKPAHSSAPHHESVVVLGGFPETAPHQGMWLTRYPSRVTLQRFRIPGVPPNCHRLPTTPGGYISGTLDKAVSVRPRVRRRIPAISSGSLAMIASFEAEIAVSINHPSGHPFDSVASLEGDHRTPVKSSGSLPLRARIHRADRCLSHPTP